MHTVTEIKFPNFTLVSVSNPTSRAIDEMARSWHLQFFDAREAATFAKRTRFEVCPEYAYLVTLWPTYRRSARDIRPAELSFYIRPEILVILQRGELPAYHELIHQFASSSELRQQVQQRTPERLLYQILRTLYLSLFPMIDHLIDDCDSIEHEIFSNHERQMILHILSIRRNITDVRKILQVHKNVLRRLLAYLTENPRYALPPSDRSFGELVDYAREDWDTLENLKERIEALQQTNESQLSFRLADIMKTLTIISVFTFPLTLVAALFSVWQNNGMPFLRREGNFWYVVGVEAIVAITMLVIFKRKRWF